MTTHAHAITCANCLLPGVVRTEVKHSMPMSYEGKVYQVEVSNLSVEKCPSCHEVYLDSDALKAMDAALRAKVRILEPSSITRYRDRLSLRKKEFAELIRMSPEAFGKVEKGDRNQSTLTDWAIRMFCASAEARRLSERFFGGDNLVVEMEASTREAENERIYRASVLLVEAAPNRKYKAPKNPYMDTSGLPQNAEYLQAA